MHRDINRPDPIDLAQDKWSADVSERDARIYALSTRILYVSSQVAASFEEESQRLGLNSGEVLVLDALRRLGPPYEASPAQLKAHFFISFAGIGKRLARLEERGLIERRTNAEDRRGQIVRLTETGLALLHESRAGNEAPHMQALRSLGPGQLEALSDALKALQDGIEGTRGD
jgi:DNA-binding MarR family transcriptional regulator